MPDNGVHPRQIGQADLRDHVALRSSEFVRVRENGMKRSGKRMVIGLLPAPDGLTRLGIVVSRRYDGKAVIRNRARRLIRENFRLMRHGFSEPHWVVVIARKHMHDCCLADVQQEFVATLQQLGIMPQEDEGE